MHREAVFCFLPISLLSFERIYCIFLTMKVRWRTLAELQHLVSGFTPTESDWSFLVPKAQIIGILSEILAVCKSNRATAHTMLHHIDDLFWVCNLGFFTCITLLYRSVNIWVTIHMTIQEYSWILISILCHFTYIMQHYIKSTICVLVEKYCIAVYWADALWFQ